MKIFIELYSESLSDNTLIGEDCQLNIFKKGEFSSFYAPGRTERQVAIGPEEK